MHIFKSCPSSAVPLGLCRRDEECQIHLVFLTPEKLSGSKALRSALHELNKQGRLSRFAIDEAHCVSQWGNDFRPDYCQLRRLREGTQNSLLRKCTEKHLFSYRLVLQLGFTACIRAEPFLPLAAISKFFS